MQQHPVPQNVTGFQFKLIGDMTVTQFVYLAAGVLIAYFITRQIQEPIFKWPLAALAFGGGFAFAFMPLEDRPLDLWVKNFIKAVYQPTMFLWEKTCILPEILQPSFTTRSYAAKASVSVGTDKNQMEEYVRSLPKNESSFLDEQEEAFLKQIQEKFNKEFGDVQKTGASEISDFVLSGISARDGATNTSSLATVSSPTQKVITIHTATGNPKVIPSVGEVKIRPLGKKHREENAPEEKPVINININMTKRPEQQEKTTDDKTVLEKAVEDLTKESSGPKVVHIGSNPKIKVAGSVETTSEEREIRTKNLQIDIDKVLKEEEKKAKKEGIADEKIQEYLKKLQEQLTQSLAEKQQLEEELVRAKKAVFEQKTEEEVVRPTETLRSEKKEPSTVKFVPSQMSAAVGVQQPTMANITAGIVKDPTGDILPDILVEIKDKNGHTKRALKSNKLGQFGIATPLDNGVYTIHLEDARGLHQFDIIEITLDGNIFPAMEIKAKNQKDAEREKLKEALFGKPT
jgi:hypothetical protein